MLNYQTVTFAAWYIYVNVQHWLQHRAARSGTRRAGGMTWHRSEDRDWISGWCVVLMALRPERNSRNHWSFQGHRCKASFFLTDDTMNGCFCCKKLSFSWERMMRIHWNWGFFGQTHMEHLPRWSGWTLSMKKLKTWSKPAKMWLLNYVYSWANIPGPKVLYPEP